MRPVPSAPHVSLQYDHVSAVNRRLNKNVDSAFVLDLVRRTSREEVGHDLLVRNGLIGIIGAPPTAS